MITIKFESPMMANKEAFLERIHVLKKEKEKLEAILEVKRKIDPSFIQRTIEVNESIYNSLK